MSEIGDSRARYPGSAALKADAGMCAMAVESSKHQSASFRGACDHRLRDAVATLADSSRHHHPWTADIHRRARGCDHPHPIRILGRARLPVIWRIWQNHTPHDPTPHGGLQRLTAPEGRHSASHAAASPGMSTANVWSSTQSGSIAGLPSRGSTAGQPGRCSIAGV